MAKDAVQTANASPSGSDQPGTACPDHSTSPASAAVSTPAAQVGRISTLTTAM
jgi:hypothetical protein